MIELTHDAIYRLPGSRPVQLKVSDKYMFLVTQNELGEWNTLSFLIAYEFLYHAVRFSDGRMEWQPTDWTIFDLEPT